MLKISNHINYSQTLGEGNGKKMSKKVAAEKMLAELRKLPPMPTTPSPRLPPVRTTARLSKRQVAQAPIVKKKPRNLIKEVVRTENGAVAEDEVTNPISRLLRIQQARKQKDPIYVVIEERGQQRRKEFVIEVDVNGDKAQGIGPNKKHAKRVAAENILIKLGFSKMDTEEAPNSTAAPAVEKTRKVTFKEPEKRTNNGGSSGRQLAPGLLLMKGSDNKGMCGSRLSFCHFLYIFYFILWI